jgi:hypothetical protein
MFFRECASHLKSVCCGWLIFKSVQAVENEIFTGA